MSADYVSTSFTDFVKEEESKMSDASLKELNESRRLYADTNKNVEEGGEFAIMYGDPIGGFTIIGPFPDYESALNEVESTSLSDESWWITELQIPETL